MSKSNIIIILPNLERALQDLEKHNRKYHGVLKKPQVLSSEIEKLKIEKMSLQMTADANKKVIIDCQNNLQDIMVKTEDIILNQNRAKLAAESTLTQINQIKTFVKNSTLELNAFEINVPLVSKLNYKQTDLLASRNKLEAEVQGKADKINELLKKINFNSYTNI